MNQIGRNINVAMSSAGLSVRDLSTKSGVPRRTLARIIAGEADVKWSIIERIAIALRVRPQSLVSPTTPTQTYTGIETIDTAVIATLMCEVDPDRIRDARHYIHPDYRCCSMHYGTKSDVPAEPVRPAGYSFQRDWLPPEGVNAQQINKMLVKSVRQSNIEILGITWDQEVEANKKWAEKKGHQSRSLSINHITLTDARHVSILSELTESKMVGTDEILIPDLIPSYIDRSGILIERVYRSIVVLTSSRPLRTDQAPEWLRKSWNTYEVAETKNILGTEPQSVVTPVNSMSAASGACCSVEQPAQQK